VIIKASGRQFGILAGAAALASAGLLLLPAAVPSVALADGTTTFSCDGSSISTINSFAATKYAASSDFGDSAIATTPSNLPSSMLGITGPSPATGSSTSPVAVGTFAAGFGDETQLYETLNNGTSGASPNGSPGAYDTAQGIPLSTLPSGTVTTLAGSTNHAPGLPFAQVFPVSGGTPNFNDPLITGGVPTSIYYESYTTNPTAWMPNGTQPNSSCGDNIYAILDFNVSSYIGSQLTAGQTYAAYLLVRDTDSSGPLADHVWYFRAPAVSPATPTISTNLSATSITAGGSAYDTAQLSNTSGTATGTVTYTVYSDTSCATVFASPPSVTLAGGFVPNSAPVAFPTTGTYYWRAHYSGDGSNSPATSACSSEPLGVTGGSGQLGATTLTTRLSSGSIDAGASVFDSATLGGATTNASGTVTYTVYSNSGCTSVVASPAAVTVTGDVIPNSAAVVFSAAGTYYWQAMYSGDSLNESATSACTSEQLVVNPVGGQLAASTGTPVTGADLFGPGLLGVIALLLGGVLVITGRRVGRVRSR